LTEAAARPAAMLPNIGNLKLQFMSCISTSTVGLLGYWLLLTIEECH
jgi:hypothetical protein